MVCNTAMEMINLNMIGVHPACVLKMLVFCNPSDYIVEFQF
jgi:hypothetical protein